MMRRLARRWFFQVGLFLFTALLLTLLIYRPSASAQEPAPGATKESASPAAQGETPPPQYTNDTTFEQLSGAARNLLELKYGKKEGITAAGESGKAAPPSLPAYQPGTTATIGPLTVINNVPVNDPTIDTTAQDTQSESALVLAGSTLVAAWNDSASFVPPADAMDKFTGFGRSTNSGANWSDGGTLPTNARGDAGDPVLAHHTASGTTYLSTINFSGSGLRVFRSTNGAASWAAPVEGGPGFGGNDFLDKEWLAVDNFAGAGNGNVYLLFRNFAGGGLGSQPGGIYLTRSTDGGLSFGPNGGLLIASQGLANVQGAFVAVGPDHSVYAFWYDETVSPRQIRVRRSTDFGVSFAAPVAVAQLNGTATNGDLGLNGGFRTNSFPHAAVNPVNGHLYVVYNDNPAGPDQADVFFTMSTNNGATWSAPVRVNNDATSTDQFMPTLGVTPNGTRLAITFYDRRLDPANNLIDRFGVIGTIAGGIVTFGPNFRITTRSFPVVVAVDPVVNPIYMGDYDMIAADNNFFYHTWGDNRDQNLTTPARNNANIRFGRFPVTGPGAILHLVSASLAPGGNGNGVIDVNECNPLNVALRNLGTSTATGITTTLSTSTPQVTVLQANSAYPNIAPGATVTNSVLFKVGTSPTFVPGTPLNFDLAATTASDGAFTFPFQLPSGSVGAPVRFDNNTPLPIPDVSTVTSTMLVTGIAAPIGKVTVSLHLTHTFDADLDIFLIAPDGTTVELTSNNGGAGDNYGLACSPDGNRTTFDDNAAASITAGTAPFAGTFRPEGSLTAFNNKTGAAVNGVWSLRIQDEVVGDMGRLQCWSLFISPFSAVDAGGAGCQEPTIFLPLVLKNSVTGPDLIVDSLVATSQGVAVTLKNVGNAPVTDAFWVDVYLNPSVAPSRVNQHWQDLGSQGLVWGVTTLPIAANGGSLTLTLNDHHYRADFSHFVPPLAVGSSVYAQVDSVNLSTTYGGVLESHELAGGAYNNIAHTISTAGAAPLSAASGPADPDLAKPMPLR